MGGFAVIDCETTGLNPVTDRIIEIGIVQLDSAGRFEREWAHTVNPGRPVDATFIHGITDDDVAAAPAFSEVLPTVVDFLQGRVVVAHNARFDIGFLNESFRRSGFPMAIPAAATACTMELSKMYLSPGRHSLVEATQRAGIAMTGHHRALVDAWAAAELLRVYLRAEAQGTRYADTVVTRSGEVMEPAAWIGAQKWAADLAWPTALF